MNTFKVVYNSFLVGLTAAVIAFQNEWLEMRVNIGLIVPIVVLVSLFIYRVKKKREHSFPFSLLSLSVFFTVTLISLGRKKGMVIVPAILREALGTSSMSLSTINIVLVVFLTIGLVVIYKGERKNRFEKLKEIN